MKIGLMTEARITRQKLRVVLHMCQVYKAEHGFAQWHAVHSNKQQGKNSNSTARTSPSPLPRSNTKYRKIVANLGLVLVWFSCDILVNLAAHDCKQTSSRRT